MTQSISVKLRNFTGFDLSRDSYGLSQGRWGNNDASDPPSDLPDSGTVNFTSESVDEFNGTSGFAQYMAAAGTFRIEWAVPVIGNYTLTVTVPPGYEQDTIDTSPAGFAATETSAPSVKIILQPPE